MKALDDRAAARTKKVGGRLCLDFVNLVGGWDVSGSRGARPTFEIRDDRLRDFADLVAFSVATAVLDGARARKILHRAEAHPQEALEVWRRAVAFRHALRGLAWSFEHKAAPRVSDLDTLSAELGAAHARRALRAREGNLEWRVEGDGEALDSPLGAIALSAEDYFINGDLTRLHTCPGNDCGWVFEDATKNRSRRWCDMRDCGNVAKVRDYRARSRRATVRSRSVLTR